jgi:cytochrome c peroxidase
MKRRHSTNGRRAALAAVAALLAAPAVAADETFRLNANCPPGFERLADNTCRLRTLYDGYESLRDAGVGGLKTALPAVRDGFSPQQIDLGRYLFFDPVLSGDHSVSCASCHHPELGFADGQARSTGVGGAEVQRAAPSLWNVAFLGRFFWDARAVSLEEQMQGPLYSASEMGGDPASLLRDIAGNPTYRRLFGDAYPDSEGPPTLQQVYAAIAAFQASLISLNSRYDRYAHGYHEALTADEIDTRR